MPLVMNKTGAAAALQHMIRGDDGFDMGGNQDAGRGQGPRSIVPAVLLLHAQDRSLDDDGAEIDVSGRSAEKRSHYLNRVIGVVIILNTIMLGLETDLASAEDPAEDRVFWILVESIFIIIFSVEIVLRMEIERWKWPCSLWNWLDVFLVIMAIVETWILNFADKSGRLRVLGLLRIVRLIRLVRVVRLIRMFRALYVTVMAFKEALSGLIYISMIMVGGVYVCAIFMTAVVGRSDLSELELGGISGSDRFGSVLRSMYSLFELMTLEGWQLVGRPLVQAEPAMAVFFFCYIMIFTFGLLNMVVAVVVEKTLMQAKRLEKMDSDILQQEVAKELKLMRDAFVKCDLNNDGMIDKNEFKESFKLEEASKEDSLAACFARLGIPTDDALTLFDILDADASGALSMKEFLNGCARVLGATDPRWDQLATHALVLGLKKKIEGFQQFQQEMLRIVGKGVEVENGTSMEASLAAPEDGSRQAPMSASELEEWRRSTSRQLGIQEKEIQRLTEDSNGRNDHSKAVLERLQRLEEHAPRSQ